MVITALINCASITLSDGDSLRVQANELVSNGYARAGKTYEFQKGQTLLLERAPNPHNYEHAAEWLVIIDTAIGGAVQYFDAMAREGFITLIVDAPQVSA